MADISAESAARAELADKSPNGTGHATGPITAGPVTAGPVGAGPVTAGPTGGEPPAAAPAPPARKAHTPIITDVWSWTSRKYRFRAAISLVINFALFSALCAFTNWLHGGTQTFAPASYLEPLRFWGPQTQNLYDFVQNPINVKDTPIHAVVIGLLFATIVGMPISVAILYRFRSALPFLAVIFVLAHLPWMAITLLASCILAALKPFRMKFKFGSALVGMLPVLLYLYLATRGAAEPLTASISPQDKLLLTAPWLLTILAACTMMAVIIFLARLVNYRPGAVAPVMVVMFATPAVLFNVYVGVDELHYRVLAARFGPRSERFEPVQSNADQIRAMVHNWTRPGSDRDERNDAVLKLLSEDPEELADLRRRITRRLLLDVMDNRRAANEACKEFIADHPTSAYIPCVLFIQGQALDTRLDERRLPAQRELYTDFPNVESEAVWKSLLDAYPQSPLAIAARGRFAQLRLRKGDAEGALAALAGIAPVPPPGAVGAVTQPGQPLLGAHPPEESLKYEPDQDRFAAEYLQELILANRDDPKYGIMVLRELAGLDPHRSGYREQLLRLATRCPDSRLYDNLLVRWAGTATDVSERAAKLQACIAGFQDGDALAEALFQLADIEVQTLGATDAAQRKTGIERLRELMRRFPQSCWARRAAERLARFDPGFPQSAKGGGA